MSNTIEKELKDKLREDLKAVKSGICENCYFGQIIKNLKKLLEIDVSPLYPLLPREIPTDPGGPPPPESGKELKSAPPRKPEKLTVRSNPVGVDGKKECKKCHKRKPIDEFDPNPQCRDGHIGTCKTCRRDYEKERRHARSEKSASPPRPVGSRAPGSGKTEKKSPAPPSPEKFAVTKKDIYGRDVILNFSCPKCRAKFLTQEQLEAHNDVHHPDGVKSYICEDCGEDFGLDRDKYLNHKDLRH